MSGEDNAPRHLFSSLHSVNVTSLLLSLLSWSISSGTFDLAPRKRVFPSKFRPFFFSSPLFERPSRCRKSSPPPPLVPPSRSRFETSYIRSYCRNSSLRHSSIRFSVSPFDRCELEHGGGWPERRGGRKRAQRFGNEWIKQRDVTGWII